MNFSDLIQQSSGLVRYTPAGDLVAVAKNFEVKVHRHLYAYLSIYIGL